MTWRARPELTSSSVTSVSFLLLLRVEQSAHVLCGGAVSLADPVHVDPGNCEAAMPHPLAQRCSGGNGAELGGHVVPQPVQRVAMAEFGRQLAEPLADRVAPHGMAPTVVLGEQVGVLGQRSTPCLGSRCAPRRTPLGSWRWNVSPAEQAFAGVRSVAQAGAMLARTEPTWAPPPGPLASPPAVRARRHPQAGSAPPPLPSPGARIERCCGEWTIPCGSDRSELACRARRLGSTHGDSLRHHHRRGG